jgi:pentatricopeptide repeat protein
LCTVECLAEAYLRADRHDLVKPLILSLDEHGLEPSAVLFAALITSCTATGAVACGMAAFQQMRGHFSADLTAVQLGYSSVINMCAQNQQLDKALELLQESRKLSEDRGLSPAAVEANLLPALLAAAVQNGHTEVALDLAQRAQHVSVTAFVQCPKERRKFKAYLEGLLALLERRHASKKLVEQVGDILRASGSDDSTDISTCSIKADTQAEGAGQKQSRPSAAQVVQSVIRLLRVSRLAT